MKTPGIVLLIVLIGCKRGEKPDAYGNFETTEVVVAAQTAGQVLWLSAKEGAQVPLGSLVGVIDTAQLSLQREQIAAQHIASRSRVTEVGQQIGVLEVQHQIAQRTYERTRRLYDQHAATAPQLDQAERDYRTLGQQIQLTRSQRQTAGQEITSTNARTMQIDDQIRRSRITNPIAGTVLVTYAKAGEFVQPGQPLYKIADLRTMELRAYVTEPQLATIKIGQQARVTIDSGDDNRVELPATISWISSEAEFTPTQIQTRDERANLVYAVKLVVPNARGAAKVGMPADVRFLTNKG